jgi:hypothetical protein
MPSRTKTPTKLIRVWNPVDKLMILNPGGKKPMQRKKTNTYRPRKKTNGMRVSIKRRRNPSFSRNTFSTAIGTIGGFTATEAVAGMLPRFGGSLGEIALKAATGYGLSVVCEKVKFLKPFAEGVFVGGLVSATKAGIDAFLPSLGAKIPPLPRVTVPAGALPAGTPVAAQLPAGTGMSDLIYPGGYYGGMGDIINRPAFLQN